MLNPKTNERELAYVEKVDKMWKYVNPEYPAESYLLPPATPDQRVRTVRFNWRNYSDALKKSPFPRYILNTLFILFFIIE